MMWTSSGFSIQKGGKICSGEILLLHGIFSLKYKGTIQFIKKRKLGGKWKVTVVGRYQVINYIKGTRMAKTVATDLVSN